MEAHFAKFFREQLHSDADIIIQLHRPFERPQELTRFPGHLNVLDQSPYFVAQRDFQRQQQQQVTNPSRRRSRSRSRSPVRTRSTIRASSSELPLSRGNPRVRDRSSPEDDRGRQSARESLVVTIEHSAHETAAVAVIGRMYGVRSAISDLQQAELVYAVQLGDMLGIESATTKAVHLLREAAVAVSGLLLETLDALAVLPSWPSCLLPLVPVIVSNVSTKGLDPAELLDFITPRNRSIRKVLVSSLGNLEEVWQHRDLSSILLSIPLQAMQLLLSADELIVYSEDTVLYTAKKYIAAQISLSQKTTAELCLSSVVRVPHLSVFQLQIHQQQHNGYLLVDPYRGLAQRLLHIHRIRPSLKNSHHKCSGWDQMYLSVGCRGRGGWLQCQWEE